MSKGCIWCAVEPRHGSSLYCVKHVDPANRVPAPEPVVLAFMQNMWVNEPERVKAMIEKNGEDFRRKIIARSLFAGCKTGRELMRAFGEDLCDEIVWEESTREIGGHASSVFPPDLEHIKKVIDELQPTIVLTFGRIADTAVRSCYSGVIITSPHPAARGLGTRIELFNAATSLKEALSIL